MLDALAADAMSVTCQLHGRYKEIVSYTPDGGDQHVEPNVKRAAETGEDERAHAALEDGGRVRDQAGARGVDQCAHIPVLL